MLDFCWPRRLSAAALASLTVSVVVSTLTPACEKELDGPKNNGVGGGAGADPCGVYRANCLTPETAWQRFNDWEAASAGGDSGMGMGGEGGEAPIPDGCPPHDGNGPLVSSPPTTSAASCCYDLGDNDRCG